jgi:hypothetical protein
MKTLKQFAQNDYVNYIFEGNCLDIRGFWFSFLLYQLWLSLTIGILCVSDPKIK